MGTTQGLGQVFTQQFIKPRSIAKICFVLHLKSLIPHVKNVPITIISNQEDIGKILIPPGGTLKRKN